MQHRTLWYVAKALEGVGMVIVLVGVIVSIQLGMGEEGLKSMQYEMRALMVGGALFLAGWFLESRIGAR